MYKQLTEENRLQIWALRKEGKNQSQISRILNIHRSTVSRELARNSGPYGYEPQLANKMARYRKQFHQQVTEKQYEELVIKLNQMGLNKEQCQRFILHYHPELDMEQLENLIVSYGQ
ncbi:helix-turn-helix domain-containing protein [Photobacterium sp. DNB23_23_1]|uniref:Helix-turn-helix domain-containing protein n=1 Tax=Photobacterium pectinilyticum TaxID=2906793 RepID=A0ABT1MZE4_9GAMM|nr:helix-turn-helix domain-containing protein [Photobacterium sp. ZSDE20]MCQ1057662.1 helix-turn-helix domain-containing protein [Photobacterium sp. ZSDE20]MDD1821933.1 helix-turn-helix domain-containing protein [Photobacterium sp. ZSDE20]